MEKIKAGIIGCGRISSVYQAAFENMKDEVELAFVVDKEVCRARKLAAAFPGCGRFTEAAPVRGSRSDTAFFT